MASLAATVFSLSLSISLWLQTGTVTSREEHYAFKKNRILLQNKKSKDVLFFLLSHTLHQDCDNLWWDAFTTEFFEDDAMLTVTFCLEDGPKRYSTIFFFKAFNIPSHHNNKAMPMFVVPYVAPGLFIYLFLNLASAAIGRTLIPRYFRSIFEGGATELFYVLKHPKESFHSNFVSLDCDQCTMVTQNGKPMFTQVLFTLRSTSSPGICC